MAAMTAALIGAAGAIGGSMISAKGAKDAAKQASNVQTLDLDELQATAREASIRNAAESLKLERELTPDVAAARDATGRLVKEDLENAGKLPVDVQNLVTRTAMESGAGAGLNNSGFVTAAQLGLTSKALRDAAIQQGRGYLQENQLPTVGLDPGQLASAKVGDIQNLNQYNQVAAQQKANAANTTGKNVATIGGIAADVWKNWGK